MRFEPFMMLLGILLLLAIVLTLLFGKEHGRHGYGARASGMQAWALCWDGSYGPPLRTG